MKFERLGNILDVQNGYAFNSEQFSEIGMPLIRIRDLKEGMDTDIKFSGNYDDKFVVRKGDFLIGMDGEFRCYEWKGKDALLNQRVCRLVSFNKNVYPKFIFYGINFFLERIEDSTSYVTVKHISSKQIKEINFPFPSLSDQIHIANILSQAEDLISQRKESIRLLDEYLKSTFLEMFGDPVRNERGWEKKCIGELGKDEKRAIKSGPFGSQLLISELLSSGIPVYGIDNVQKNKFIDAKPKFISELKYKDLIAFRIEANDILITRTGTVGRTCLAPKNIEKCIIGPNLLKISLNENIVLPIYISIAFNYCESIIYSIKELSPGATVAVFNTTNLKALKIGVPPLELQTQFAHIVEKTEVMKEEYKRSLAELEKLYGSLSQKAFRGELEGDVKKIYNEESTTVISKAAEQEVIYVNNRDKNVK